MKVSELGEFGLVDLLGKMVENSQDLRFNSWRQLILGIGDDAAAWYSDSSIQLAHVDSLFQDIHFRFDLTSWHDLGWKSLAVTVSDIAAMGGIPTYALVSLTLLDDNEVDDVTTMYRGMIELAKRYGIAIIGGDTSRAPVVSITVTVLGTTIDRDKANILTRNSARPGDKIAITGYLGSAAAGFRMLSEKLKFDDESTSYLRDAFCKPLPRVSEGLILVRNGVKVGIDVSDGLISDLNHICKASHVSARINADKLPIHLVVKSKFKKEAIDLALSGGEDYELLFAAPDAVMEKVKTALSCPVTVIGEIAEEDRWGKAYIVDSHGKPYHLRKPGWEHFRLK